MPAVSSCGYASGFGNFSAIVNSVATQAIINIDAVNSTQTVVNATTRTLSNLNTSYPTYTYTFRNATYPTGYIEFASASNSYGYNSTSLLSIASAASWRETKEMWIWVATGNLGTNGTVLTEQGTTTIDSSWYDSQVEIITNKLKVGVWNGGISTLQVASSLTQNAWHHVVWRYNGTTLDAYLDGVKTTGITTGRQTPTNGLYYFLGSGTSTNMGSGKYFDGRIAVYRYYNYALSDAQVAASFAADRGRFGV
jgi:Concanavalin A-like lectin/glucanases superfamily